MTLGALDETPLPKDGAAIIVCASYNGLPTDNAVKFQHWLREEGTSSSACAGLAYTVFGCGNTEWAATYQADPDRVRRGAGRARRDPRASARRGRRTR